MKSINKKRTGLIEYFYKYMKITNWNFERNRTIINSNDNIVSGKDQPQSLLKSPFPEDVCIGTTFPGKGL